MYSKGIYARSNRQNLHSIVGPYANSCNDDNLEFMPLQWNRYKKQTAILRATSRPRIFGQEHVKSAPV